MKIIFLDIDGVLNSEEFFKQRHKNLSTREEYQLSMIDPECVKRLNKLVEKTGAKVVISSTWRSGKTPSFFNDLFRKSIGPNSINVIDTTPFMSAKSSWKDMSTSIPRGCEIEQWLKKFGFQRINWSEDKQLEYLEKSKVKNYIILDDDSDMLLSQYEHFLKVPNKCGLTNEIVNKGIKILNKTIIHLYYTDYIE